MEPPGETFLVVFLLSFAYYLIRRFVFYSFFCLLFYVIILFYVFCYCFMFLGSVYIFLIEAWV